LEATVERLADDDFAGRRSGTPGAREAAEYLRDRFALMGLEVAFQDIDTDRRNVVARLGESSEHIIVGAHYDGQGGANPGASDNAAGIAVMLELAGQFSDSPPGLSIVFIAFDDEEQGLNGSRFYASNPVYPLADTRAVVILDTMGRGFLDLDETPLIVLGTEQSGALAEIVSAKTTGDAIAIGTDLIGARSDFAPFAARRVPYLFFTHATHEDYHGRGDTAERIRYGSLRQASSVIRDVVLAIARLSVRPVYASDPVYPPGEADSLLGILSLVEEQRPDVASRFGVLFDDARARLADNPTRLNLRLATELLLAAATPRFAFFSLAYVLGPLYETEANTAAALAAYREAVRWAPDATMRGSIQERIDSLVP
jgi:hypothetical protein